MTKEIEQTEVNVTWLGFVTFMATGGLLILIVVGAIPWLEHFYDLNEKLAREYFDVKENDCRSYWR